jgi:radical SAM protein with 4Fe4S-binding SPASM domain
MQRLSKTLKMGRIFLDYRRRSPLVATMPIRLWVESTSICNLKCVMCPNKDMSDAEKGIMSLDLFQKIVSEVKGYCSDLYLHHRGEPFVNPALFDMIKVAKAAGINTRFHSNGSIMTEERARKLLEAGPDLVSFSVDGFDKVPYERVRVGATFEKTLENIFRLLSLRREMGLKKPYIVIEKITFKNDPAPANPEAVSALKRRFEEAGVDEIIEKVEYTWAEDKAPELAAPPCKMVCTFPWYAAVICWDGTVTPCPQDFFAKMNMGNVNQSSLRDIWNGPAYQTLRRKLAGDLHSLPLCHKCDRLRRKTVGGIPLQYMFTFLTDHLVGYNRWLRKLIGTSERN